MFRLTDATWSAVLGHRPTDALWGIGRKTARRLEQLGVRTVDELAAADPGVVAAAFGPRAGPWLVRRARGDDDSPVVGDPYVARSRGREVTFQRDLDDWAAVHAEVVTLAHRVAADVAAEARPAVRVVVKVRFAPFSTHTHGQQLDAPTAEPAPIERAALAALDRFDRHRAVRLLGVRAELGR